MNRETNAWPVDKEKIGDEVKEFGKNAKEVAASTIEAVKENASKYYQQGVEKAKDVEKNLEGKIKEYPLKSLLIAVGVGALVGMLIKRR